MSQQAKAKLHDIRTTCIGGNFYRYRITSVQNRGSINDVVEMEWLKPCEATDNVGSSAYRTAVESYDRLVRRGAKDHLRQRIESLTKLLKKLKSDLRKMEKKS